MNHDPKVYVVDDNVAERRLMTDVLKAQGHAVVEFGSGEEFLEKHRVEDRGCVVTDMRMFGISGLDIQKELLNRNSHLPVIVVSSYATVPDAVTAMQLNAVTLLQKPWSEQDLIDSVAQALEQDARVRELRQERDGARRCLSKLTDSEREVLDLLVAGKANKQVARIMDIGLRTAELRRSNILKKIGVTSLAEAVRLAVLAERPLDEAS